MIAYFARMLDQHGHKLTPEQLCLMADAWVGDSTAHAIDEYAPYFLYFNQVLWHHGSSAPGQARPAAAGYVASSSHDYVRPENRAVVALDREKIRQMNRSDVEQKVASGEFCFGPAKEVTERLIEIAEHHGANSLLVNLNLGAVPHDLHPRAGAPLRPRGAAEAAGAQGDARAGRRGGGVARTPRTSPGSGHCPAQEQAARNCRSGPSARAAPGLSRGSATADRAHPGWPI